MSRTPSKGIGMRRTIYLPTDLIRPMGAAMAAIKDPVVNHFICEAIRRYCEEIQIREQEGGQYGKEET